MDSERFDRLTKRLATGANRRGILKGLVGGAAAVVGGGLTRRPAAAQTEPVCDRVNGTCNTDADCCLNKVETCGAEGDTAGECCRTEIGIFCADAPIDRCCGPNYICVTPTEFPPHHGEGCQCNTAAGFEQHSDGSCQCPEHFAVCDGQCISTEHCCAGDTSGHFKTCGTNEECVGGSCRCKPHFAKCDGQCISTEHCCASDNHAPFDVCEDDEKCVNGTCKRECIENGQPSYHKEQCCSKCLCDDKCCHEDHCKEPECVAVDKPCNKFHPCCHPEEFVCSSQTREPGKCKRRNDETCDETKDTLCQKAGFKSKCCPGKHRPCNENKNGTFNCGIKEKESKDEVKKESSKRRDR